MTHTQQKADDTTPNNLFICEYRKMYTCLSLQHSTTQIHKHTRERAAHEYLKEYNSRQKCNFEPIELEDDRLC